MFSNRNPEVSLNHPARCIASLSGDKGQHRFIVGTCSTIRSSSTSSHPPQGVGAHTFTSSHSLPSNRIYILRYHEDLTEVTIDGTLDHYTGEVWCCSACPFDRRLLITCGGGGGVASSVLGHESSTVLWRLPDGVLRDDDEIYAEADDDLSDDGRIARRGESYANTLRNAQDRGTSDSIMTMEEVCTLVHPDEQSTALRGRVSDMVWNPESFDSESMTSECSTGCNMITVGYGSNIVTTWDIGTTSALPIQRIDVSPATSTLASSHSNRRKIIQTPPRAAWDPHDTHVISITNGPDVVLYDLRSSQKNSGGMSSCHPLGVTSLDYNPNKPHVMTTCGQDGFIKFWDLRFSASSSRPLAELVMNHDSKPTQKYYRQGPPLKVLQGGHSHWTSVVQYNKSHDQLLLSGGTDGIVNLWRISSISSAPLVDLGDKDDDFQMHNSFSKNPNNGNRADEASSAASKDESTDGHEHTNENDKEVSDAHLDVRIASHEMNEAVYSLSWSAADPWVYASLSYDGTVVVRNVPSKEKYKILL